MRASISSSFTEHCDVKDVTCAQSLFGFRKVGLLIHQTEG